MPANNTPVREIPATSQSTPYDAGNEDAIFDPGISPFRLGQDFVFLSSACNVKRNLLGPDPDSTVLRDITQPAEPNPPTSAIWKDRPSTTHKYIDDSIIDTKLNMENVLTVDGGRAKHAVACQNVFRRTIRNAESIGMRVNEKKTNQICVSDAMSFKASSHVYTIGGDKLISSDSLKLLGFHFGTRPSCHQHVEAIRRSFTGRYWLIIHMKQNGYTEKEMLKAYTTIIRPIAEYVAPAFHSQLTDKQDQQIEKLQATALMYIFGFGPSYAKMLDMAGIETLRFRRITLTDKFAEKCLKNDRFSAWFPEARRVRNTRASTKYLEEYARCERLKNSPVFYMRRRLNGGRGRGTETGRGISGRTISGWG